MGVIRFIIFLFLNLFKVVKTVVYPIIMNNDNNVAFNSYKLNSLLSTYL